MCPLRWHVCTPHLPCLLWVQFLGETLDSIFKKAGVLVEVAKDPQDGSL